VALQRHPGPSWTGSVEGPGASLILIPTSFDDAWGVGGGGQPFPAFGWALGFEAEAGGHIRVEFGGQPTRTIQVIALGVLWLVALWALASSGRRARTDRRPGGRRVPAPAPSDGRPEPVGTPTARGGGR
jgi:hypothetical protein